MIAALKAAEGAPMRIFGTIIPVTLAVVGPLPAHALVVATPDEPVANLALQSQAASVMTPWVEAELVPARLSDLPEVLTSLKQRAAAVNWRASVGRVTAEDLYRKIPVGVRLAGEKAVLDFLDVHDVSHIRSVSGHPELAASTGNVVFEPRRWNQGRGPRDMGSLDKLRVWTHNAHVGWGAARPLILTNFAKSSIIAALVELPVSAFVETQHVVNGRKAPGQAALDAAQSVGITTALVGSTTGVVTMASALGVTVGTPVLVGFAVVGGSLYAWNSGERIWQAIGDDTRAAAIEKVAPTKEVAHAALRDGASALRDQVGGAVDAVSEWFHIHKSKFRL